MSVVGRGPSLKWSQVTRRACLSPDWGMLAVSLGHLVLAGDAGSQRSGHERQGGGGEEEGTDVCNFEMNPNELS